MSACVVALLLLNLAYAFPPIPGDERYLQEWTPSPEDLEEQDDFLNSGASSSLDRTIVIGVVCTMYASIVMFAGCPTCCDCVCGRCLLCV